MQSILAVSIVMLVAAQTPSSRATSPAANPDAKELAAYRLTLPGVQKLAAVMRAANNEPVLPDPRAIEIIALSKEIGALNANTARSRAEEARLTTLNARVAVVEGEMRKAAREEPPGDTIDGLAAQLSRQPGMVRSLAREKLSARDFAACYLALLQASLAVQLNTVPPGVSPQNIAFIKANEKALEEALRVLDGFGGR